MRMRFGGVFGAIERGSCGVRFFNGKGSDGFGSAFDFGNYIHNYEPKHSL